MNVKTIVFLFLLLPFWGMAQTENWQLSINKTKLAAASVDSIVTVQLPAKDSGLLQFDFHHRDTSFNRSFLIMNEQRNTLFQQELTGSQYNVKLPLQELRSKTNGQPVTVYLADIPSDPAKAMLVRVAPVAICRIQWKQ